MGLRLECKGRDLTLNERFSKEDSEGKKRFQIDGISGDNWDYHKTFDKVGFGII